MKIVIVGPRSVGKSTTSIELSKKIKINLYESDAIMNKYLKKNGGLDKVIKKGLMDKYISKTPNMIGKVLKKNKYVLDLAGGAIASRRYGKEAEKIIKLLKKYKPLVIGLLPCKNNKTAVEFLFKREQKRKHFINQDKKILFNKTKEDYLKVKDKINEIADIIYFVENNSKGEIAKDLIGIINREYQD